VKQRIIERVAVALSVVIGAVVVSAQLYLRRESEQYSREVGEIKQRNAAYQRGVVSGEPIEQNAAALYRLALPHFSVWGGQDKILADAINAADAGHGATALIRERCAEIRSERIRQALSSTRCDWQLGFALDQLNADFAEKLDGLRLARCLVVSGHDAASAGDRRQALSSYLQTIAVGCDLGMGDESMCVLGGASVTLGLTAIARLVMRTDDRAFLRDVAHRVSMFEGRWPDPRWPLRRYRLWLENAVALDALASDGKRSTRVRSLLFRSLAAWRLWRDQPFLRQLQRLTAVSNREESVQAAHDLMRQPRHSKLLQEADGSQYEGVVTMAFDLVDTYRALQLAIELQDWHSEHHEYPPDASSIRMVVSGLRYEPMADRRGYKIVGAHATIFERAPE